MGYASALTRAPRQAAAALARSPSARTPSPAPCGNQALLRRLQAKLKVGSVNDPLEHEADRVADQVMRMPAPGAALTSAPPQFSRKCAACEEEEKLQKKEAGPQAAAGEAPASVHEALCLPGQPLDAATRAYFEPRFGHDFSSVRVHSGPAAAQSARDVNAHAYTVGHNVAFDLGRFAPATAEGKKLLAHELAHVTQQSGRPRVATAPSANAMRPTGVTAIQPNIVQRDFSDSALIVEAGDFVNANLYSLINKDYDDVASRLYVNFAARAYNYHYVNVVFRHLPNDVEDNVGADFTDILAKKSLLDMCAADPLGRTMLNVLYEAIITGDVTGFERKQAQRILDAKAKFLRPEDFIKSTKKDSSGRPTQIFPVRNMRVTPAYDDAPLEAKLISGSKVRVKYPGRIRGASTFANDFRTLQGDPFSSEGSEINPNEIVGIRDYDTDPTTVLYRTALELIDYSNRVEHATLGKIVQVSIVAATLGFGGGAVASAEAGEAAAVRFTATAIWGARIATAVRVLDVAANVIGVAAFVIDENRQWIIKKLGPAGKLLVHISDVANSAVAIYGLGRLAHAGFKLAKDFHAAASAARASAKDLTNAEASIIEEVDYKMSRLSSEIDELAVEVEPQSMQLAGESHSLSIKRVGNELKLSLCSEECGELIAKAQAMLENLPEKERGARAALKNFIKKAERTEKYIGDLSKEDIEIEIDLLRDDLKKIDTEFPKAVNPDVPATPAGPDTTSVTTAGPDTIAEDEPAAEPAVEPAARGGDVFSRNKLSTRGLLPDETLGKQLEGTGQMKDLQASPNLKGVGRDELPNLTPRQLAQRVEDGKMPKDVFNSIMKTGEGRNLGGRR